MRHATDAPPPGQPRARRRRCPQPRRITSCQFSRQPCTPSRTPSRGESPSPHRPPPPGSLVHLDPVGGLALLAPAGLAATAALRPASRAAASRTPSAARPPDNTAGRRASGVPRRGLHVQATRCYAQDHPRKWPRTSTVRSAEPPGSARTRVAQVENRSHSVSNVRSPSSLSMPNRSRIRLCRTPSRSSAEHLFWPARAGRFRGLATDCDHAGHELRQERGGEYRLSGVRRRAG